jgi:hypothetical protein
MEFAMSLSVCGAWDGRTLWPLTPVSVMTRKPALSALFSQAKAAIELRTRDLCNGSFTRILSEFMGIIGGHV